MVFKYNIIYNYILIIINMYLIVYQNKFKIEFIFNDNFENSDNKLQL